MFPQDWKHAKIIPTPKSNNDFRPIAILPFLSKVIENLMSNQMSKYLNSLGLLSDSQSGFRQGRSCVTALSDVVENLRVKLDDNMVSFLVLLDHSKAFDTVDHTILITKLEKLFNFSSTACKLIQSYLSNRYQSVSMNNRISDALHVARGVPQGSILGPLLFCIYINDLPSVLSHCSIQMYADDVQLYISSETNKVDRCLEFLNSDLSNVHSWASMNGLCLNPAKTKCMTISRKNTSVNINNCLKINNVNIDFVHSATNLGIIFNSQLTWTNHIKAAVARVHAMLRNLWIVQISTPFAIRMLLAKTYLIPVLLYGCEIYSNCDSIDSLRLNVAYNNIARYVFKKRRRDNISAYSYQIYNISFNNLLNYKCLLLMQKIINTKEPKYLYDNIIFARSNRGNKLILPRFKLLLSERQFFVHTTRLWNNLPNNIQIISNTHRFKKELLKLF